MFRRNMKFCSCNECYGPCCELHSCTSLDHNDTTSEVSNGCWIPVWWKRLQKHILDISRHVWHWNEERFTKRMTTDGYCVLCRYSTCCRHRSPMLVMEHCFVWRTFPIRNMPCINTFVDSAIVSWNFRSRTIVKTRHVSTTFTFTLLVLLSSFASLFSFTC